MKMIFAACVAAASCAGVAQAQSGAPASTPVLSLEQAVVAAGGAAPAADAAGAAIEAAQAARTVAGLRPNPVAQGQIENVVGTGPYSGLNSAETTLGVAIPIELGGKRSARLAVAQAQLSRAEVQAAVVAADIRLQVTQLYVAAVAAERRLATARDQARIAADVLRAATVRVQAGRASPLEEQRAQVARLTADATVERFMRLAEASRANLARRIAMPTIGALDMAMLDRLPPVDGTAAEAPTAMLALAAADADLAIAEGGVRLARANRVPDLNIGPALRRLEATRDMAAVFSVSIPIPLFDNGRAAVARAQAERLQADAQRRMTALDLEQAITDAQADLANADTAARTTVPALAAAQEAARIARIGYREGKFGQIDLLDAERTLADTRLAAIDALADYHTARARLARLTAPVPAPMTGEIR
ncbi:TolC family protein [Sphingomonas panni]|uniref:TolC family protein n=1 Tax=Sphingomonas panni TaxID=237612 RepID=UPI001F5B04D9|nr:TolC family protein [Sphingomonas panni]